MSKRWIKQNATDQTLDIFVGDSSSTVGAGLTGLVYNSSGLTCYYRKGATGTATQLTLATQTVGGAHSDGGFVQIDSTNMPGVYRLDLSDTICDTAGMVTIYLRGATNMAPVVLEIEVVSVNIYDTVRFGLTALPNAAADAAGGLPISDAGGLDLDARLDAAISSRMATYTQPTGFLAATFPTTVASTTNITSVGSIGTGGITAASFASGAIDAAALAADASTEIADAVLLRNASNVESTAGEHTLCTIILAMLEHSISGTTLTIKRTDGSTTHATKTLTVDAAADPITGIQ